MDAATTYHRSYLLRLPLHVVVASSSLAENRALPDCGAHTMAFQTLVRFRVVEGHIHSSFILCSREFV